MGMKIGYPSGGWESNGNVHFTIFCNPAKSGFRSEANQTFSEFSLDDARSQDFQNSDSTHSLHANLTNKNSNVSLASMDSKIDSKSLCSSENESGVALVSGNFGPYNDQLMEQVAQLLKFKEHFEEVMEFRQVNI